jgi:hypothetical protein
MIWAGHPAGRWRDKAQLCLRYGPQYIHRAINPNEPDRGMVRLPAPLSSFYYLLRPI